MGFKEILPSSEAEWLDIRTKVLTASDMGCILGLNKFKSIKELLESKVNPVPFENAYTIVGQWLEPVVVQAVNKALGRNFKLFEDTPGARSFFVDFEVGLGATPDAGDGVDLLECKTTKPGNSLRWSFWPPSYYLSQLYTQMICCEADSGYLGVLSTDLSQKSPELSLKLDIHRVDRTEKLDSTFLEETARFWETIGRGKQFRVDRKKAMQTELLLRTNIRKVYP